MACAQEAAQEVLHDVGKIEDPLLRQKVPTASCRLLSLSLPAVVVDDAVVPVVRTVSARRSEVVVTG